MAIKFIEDKEFDLSNEENEDLLGTKPYAETLFEVVKGSSGKQNIGLFGGWGSGKSTIISTLESFVKVHNFHNKKEKIAYFKYDAWKYSNDDFRRSFIKSLNSEFKILKEEAIDNILYKETTTQDPKKSKTPINGKRISLLILSAVILLLIIGMFVLPKIKDDDTKSILVLVSLLASFLFYLSRDFFRVIPFTIKQSKLIEPEKFEETFKLIIAKIFGIDDDWMTKFKKFILSEKDYKKIVVVIDNLDRCDNENLKETLATMKNFLETENVIFIIPVDENGITSFLNGETEDAEEYLRKIFHQIIRLKKFTPKELVDFTNKINKKYELELSKIGIRLICQEFTTNPRKIIQFLNNLQTERDLIKRQIGKEYISLEFDNKADEFLIKLLIIKQEWNHLYQILLDDINFLNKINSALRNQIEQKNQNFILKLGKNELVLTRNQKRFFKRNRDVHFDKIEPFILNIDIDKDVPDELRILIENGELKEVLELLNIDAEKGINKREVRTILEQIEIAYDYNSNKFEDYNSIASPILEILVGLLEYKNVKNEIRKNLRDYTFIKSVFSNNEFTQLIPNFVNFKDLCRASKWFLDDTSYKMPYNRLFQYLNNSIKPDTTVEGIHRKIEEFIEIFKTDIALIKGLRSNLEGKVIEEPKLLGSYPTSPEDFEVTTSLFGPKFIDKMLENLNEDKIEDEKAKNILISLAENYIEKEHIKDELIITELTNYYFKKLSEEYTSNSTAAKGVFSLDSIINKLIFLIPKSDNENINIDDEILSNIHLKLKREFLVSLNKEEKALYISFPKMCFKYMKLNNDFSTLANIEKYINTYFNYDDQTITLGVNEIFQEHIKYYPPYNWNFFDIIIEKIKLKYSSQLYSTLMLMYNKTTEKKGLTSVQKQVLIDKLLLFLTYWSNYPSVLNHLKNWLAVIYKKDFKMYAQTITNLEGTSLRNYAYSIKELNNEDLILDSYSRFLYSQKNYKKFEKFVRFVKENHPPKTQETLLLDVCSKKYPPFDWLFSCRNVIHKSAFNNIVKKYISYYSQSPINTNYLNNFLKLNKKELYSSTINSVLNLLGNLKNPTKGHKNKVSELKNRLK